MWKLGRSFNCVIVPLVALLLLAGCVGEKPKEATAPEEVEKPAGKIIEEGIKAALPKSDVAGTDLKDVPRYKPSVRSEYSKGDGYMSLSYYTTDSVDRVRDFYLKELQGGGWVLTGERAEPGISFFGYTVEESRSLDFEKENKKVDLTIGRLKIGGTAYTTIEVYYTYQATIEELTEVTPIAGKMMEWDGKLKALMKEAWGADAKLVNYLELPGQFTMDYKVPTSLDLREAGEKLKTIVEKQYGAMSLSADPQSVTLVPATGEGGIMYINLQKEAGGIDISATVLAQ